MQLQASIDEADIGQVKIGQAVQFTVDAYPERQFSGAVTQIRLQPSTVQNVVTYTVMIDFDNPDGAILPGMTANMTIVVQQAHDVLKVPLAALKFTPSGFQAEGKGNWKRPDSASEAHRRPDSTKQTEQRGVSRKKEQHARIFVLDNNKPKRVPVKTGLSNSGYVAIEGDVAPGQPVIMGTINQSNKAGTQQQTPFGGGPGGMPRRF